jgi:hypothetical protein
VLSIDLRFLHEVTNSEEIFLFRLFILAFCYLCLVEALIEAAGVYEAQLGWPVLK